VRHHADWLLEERHHGEQSRDLVRKRIFDAALPAGAMTASIDREQSARTIEPRANSIQAVWSIVTPCNATNG
jgi:hypothetical protein